MALTLAAIALLACSGVPSLLRRGEGSLRWETLLVLVASALGIWGCIPALLGDEIAVLHLPWPLPFAALSVGLDALSALFLIPILLLSALAALYGSAYLRGHGGAGAGRSPFFYGVLAASMATVVIARNGMLFLIAWEVMALASFFLVTHDDRSERVRRAGIIYLIATHIGTAFLLALFALMAARTGSMEFDAWRGAAVLATSAGALFLLAVVGFGTKAGFMPLHVWLPEAHPAAPSHVSAVMSGVMIKTGIYGLMRLITLFGAPPEWWGWLLIGIGTTSGVLGVLTALAQHELKALLAYCSVENVGIIALGMGMGLVGVSRGMPVAAALGFAGALLHVINHALFKGLLFLGAGAVISAAGTGEIDRLGGLLRRMPRTAAAFLTGSAAISGLPPLNGFVSELLIYLAAFALLGGPGATIFDVLPGLVTIASLALIGGLAAACFAKAFGVTFLGEPRSPAARDACEPASAMCWPMAILAGCCAAIGLAAPLVPRFILPAVAVIVPSAAQEGAVAIAAPLLTGLSMASAALIASAAVLLLIRRRLLRRREVRRVVTWDCGYAAPTGRMQYTASSFAQPLMRSFSPLVHVRAQEEDLQGIFPDRGSFSTRAGDWAREEVFEPLFASVAAGLGRMRVIQHGNVHLYILYIAVALIALLAYTFGGH